MFWQSDKRGYHIFMYFRGVIERIVGVEEMQKLGYR